MSVIQDKTRVQIRQMILRSLPGGIAGTATGGGDNASLIDAYNFAKFANGEIVGRMVYMSKTAGVAATDKTFISVFDAATFDATLAPVVSGAVAAGDTYEMYPPPFNVDDVNDAIDRAIIDVSARSLQTKNTETTYTERDVYKYNCLSGFEALHTVEYSKTADEAKTLHECNSVWDGATDVTVSTDSKLYRQGSACNKLVVADGVAAGALLATVTIDEADLSNYDTIEFWVYSTIAQTAANLEFYLDDTAACASPVDTMSLPALTADTWTRCQLTMTNPELDTAIISIGLGQKAATDVGACTIWIDYVRTLKSESRRYENLNPAYWDIVEGSTPYLKLKPTGLSICGSNNVLRLSGYQLPSLLTADSTTCEIDPEFVIEYALAYLLLYNSKARQFNINNRENIGNTHLALANEKKLAISTNFEANTRMIG